MELLWLALSLIIWATLHSFTANERVKNWFARNFGSAFSGYYRLFYNFFAIISLLPSLLIYIQTQPATIFKVPAPFSYFLHSLQLIGVLLMGLAVKSTGFASFIGVRPASRPISGQSDLIQTGLYAIVRHPIYTGTYLFMLADPSMTTSKLLMYLILAIYLRVGVHFEERRLIREFGDSYLEYKKVVPMLVPSLKRIHL